MNWGFEGARNWGCHAKRQRRLERNAELALRVVETSFWLSVIVCSIFLGV